MKHFILIIFLSFAIAQAGSAQTTKKKTTKKETKVSKNNVDRSETTLHPGDTTHYRMKRESDSSSVVESKILKNNRRIYHWKDGQRATPTGHEATGVGGGYSALKKRPKPLAKDTVPPTKKHIKKNQ